MKLVGAMFKQAACRCLPYSWHSHSYCWQFVCQAQTHNGQLFAGCVPCSMLSKVAEAPRDAATRDRCESSVWAAACPSCSVQVHTARMPHDGATIATSPYCSTALHGHTVPSGRHSISRAPARAHCCALLLTEAKHDQRMSSTQQGY